jgi:hypothetical protein
VLRITRTQEDARSFTRQFVGAGEANSATRGRDDSYSILQA